MSGIKNVFGGAAFWTKGDKLAEEATTKKVLDILVRFSTLPDDLFEHIAYIERTRKQEA